MSDHQPALSLPSRLRCVADVWWMPMPFRAVMREAADWIEARETERRVGIAQAEAAGRAVEAMDAVIAQLRDALVDDDGQGADKAAEGCDQP
jgi:hypothetical protein